MDSRLSFLNALLRFVSSIAFLLLGIRMLATETDGYFFLTWNLGLAAIPYIVASFFEWISKKHPLSFLWNAPILLVWFFFFPNAPYIVTDFIHLPWEYASSIFFLYDFLLVGSFASAGILFGILSLVSMKATLERMWGSMLSDFFLLLSVCLSGVGVYLGRFLRLNSWQVVTEPLTVIHETALHFASPAWMLHALLLSFLFSLVTVIPYLFTLFLLRHSQPERE
ncbi:MAG: DUF1361 domain-containing protein [Candidatus Moraniibacteriota bacterium]|nr:MAG: DUF1361 domain-containing protein [Candidatus Moranbacteria bacterium]